MGLHIKFNINALLKKNSLYKKLSYILAIMLLNSCATSSNNSYRLSEDLKKKDFPELLSVNDLFYVNDLNED